MVLGRGSWKLRIRTIKNHTEVPIVLPVDIYREKSFAMAEGLQECEKRSARDSSMMITLPAGGEWGPWIDGHLYTAKRPQVWYWAISDCENNYFATSPGRIRFEFIATQPDGSEFSAERSGVQWILLLQVLVFGAFSCHFYTACRRFVRSAESLHPLVITLACIIALQALVLLFEVLHMWRYAYNGYGLKALDVISQMLSVGDEVIVTSLLILIASGYTLLQSDLGDLDIVIPIVFMVAIIHILIVGFGKVKDDASYKFYENEGVAGYLLSVMRLCLLAWFLWAINRTGKQASPKLKYFLNKFSAVGILYFLSYPMLIISTDLWPPHYRYKVMLIGDFAVKLGVFMWLTTLFLTRGDYFQVSTLNSSFLPGGLRPGWNGFIRYVSLPCMDFVTSALEVIGVNLHKDEREGRWKFDIDPLRLSGTVAGFGLAFAVMNRLEGHRASTPAATTTGSLRGVPFSSFWKQLKDSQVNEIAFIPSVDGTMPPMLRYRSATGEASQEALTVALPGCSEMVADEAMKKGIRCYTSTEADASLAMLQMMADLIGWTASLAGFLILYRMYSGDGVNGPFGAKKTPTASTTKNVTKFSDVAGHEQTKVELREIVQYLRDPQSFSSLGARPPLGVLLEGPSGVGKTLLGRATAGEANDIPFLYASGSEFVEVYVGQGAKRVREVFAQARAVSPCILFIDELDAIGSRNFRGGDGQEYTQTINQLLIEMDGISDRDGVVVMAATNRFDGLDSSLTRPGRFDRCIHVSLPDAAAREQCFIIHGKKLKLGGDVDNKALAAETEGMTGADIEHILNQAALVAARNKESCVSQGRILESCEKLRAERREREERQRVKEGQHGEIPFDQWAAQTFLNLAKNNQKDSPEVD
ncbi:hypothetical protein FOZ60_010665 [Perkinsus olseni]|uniref:AAA+ ATPase domain-containing protein n=3 Tax=Perkinsus olseni TaxID=32597 RepID=A0A7J6NEV4_PEROL|nr:hypothetical protein FOZ60_010665 [Perkinsus olseni]